LYSDANSLKRKHFSLISSFSINFSALFRLKLNFIGFYGVLLEFEKRISVNMQEINSKLWIMGWIMEGANKVY